MPACTDAKVPSPYDHYVHEPSQYAPTMHWHLVPPLRSLYTRSTSGPRDHPLYDPQQQWPSAIRSQHLDIQGKEHHPDTREVEPSPCVRARPGPLQTIRPRHLDIQGKEHHRRYEPRNAAINPTKQDKRLTRRRPYVRRPQSRRAISKFTCRPARRPPIRNPSPEPSTDIKVDL